MGFPKYFVFGKCYTPVESFIRIDDAETSKMVTPGAGEVPLRGTFSLAGCQELAQRGVVSECDREEIESAVGAWERLTAISRAANSQPARSASYDDG
jgi:hypothetical protein